MVDRVIGAATSAILVGSTFLTNDLTTPIIGVGLTAVAGAVLGTGVALGWEDSPVVRPRGRMYALAFSTVFTTIFITGLVPAWAGWHWTNSGVEFGLSGITAVACYFLMPAAIKRAGELIRAFKLSDLPLFRRRDADVTPAPGEFTEGQPPDAMGLKPKKEPKP